MIFIGSRKRTKKLLKYWISSSIAGNNVVCSLTGKYLYIKSSAPSVKGNVAQLKSALLPPAGEKGYCLTFWYHMFGTTVGSLKMYLHSADQLKKTLVEHAYTSSFLYLCLFFVI